MKKEQKKEEAAKKVTGFRKSCKADGVGLSHYILIGKETKDEK